MTASVVEVQSVTVAASSTSNVSIATSLVASDVVVAVASLRNAPPTANTITTGLGATWTSAFSFFATRGGKADYASGVTGTGTVSLQNTGGVASRATVLVIRGLNSTALTGIQDSTWNTTTTTAGVTVSAPSQSFDVDQVAILVGMAQVGTITIPVSATPATGWTVDDNFASGSPVFAVAHRVGDTTGTVQAGITSSSTTVVDTVMMVFGSVGSAPPLTSTFVGWGNPIF